MHTVWNDVQCGYLYTSGEYMSTQDTRRLVFMCKKKKEPEIV